MKPPTQQETIVSLLVLNVRNMGVPSAKGEYDKNKSCHGCAHVRSHPHTHHVLCAKPCATVTGSPHGIERGWFMYPFMFDPVWRTSECGNYEPAAEASPAVSHAVSQAEQ